MTFPGRAALFCLWLFPTAASADEFADFRIPEHRVFSWTGDLSGSASHGKSSLNENGDASGSVSTSISWLHDSDPWLSSFLLQLQGNGLRSNAENDQVVYVGFGLPPLHESTHRRSAAEQWRIAASDRRYPIHVPVAIQLDAGVRGQYQQNWLNQRTRTPFLPNTIDEDRETLHRQDYDYLVTGGATLGAGRVRDATSLYDVLVLERRLKTRGFLRGSLERRTRQRLAQLMYERGDYNAVLDRPARGFWERAVEILREDPSVPSEMDAVSLLRVLEPYLGASGPFDFLPRSPIARLRGFFMGATTLARYEARLSHFSESRFEQQTVNDTLQPPFSFDFSSNSHYEARQIDVGPSMEWHRPVGPRWQWDALGNVLFHTRGVGGLSVNSSSSVAWILADRWLVSGSVRHFSVMERAPSGAFANLAWDVEFIGTLAWYVEDRLQISIAGKELERRFGSYDREEGIQFGLGYRFAGRIESPSLAEPIRVP